MCGRHTRSEAVYKSRRQNLLYINIVVITWPWDGVHAASWAPRGGERRPPRRTARAAPGPAPVHSATASQRTRGHLAIWRQQFCLAHFNAIANVADTNRRAQKALHSHWPFFFPFGGQGKSTNNPSLSGWSGREIRLVLTINPACSFTCPLHLLWMVPVALGLNPHFLRLCLQQLTGFCINSLLLIHSLT